jgi:hypothetical protein
MQAMSMGVSIVLPVSSGATCGHDTISAIQPYEWRSAGVVGKAISWGPVTWRAIMSDGEQLALARAAVAETKRIRPIGIAGDYYPLTEITASPSVNVAYQFHHRNEGFVYAFHRAGAPTELSLRLQGVDPALNYQLRFSRNYSLERTLTMSGAQMRNAVPLSFQASVMRDGINVTAGSMLIEYGPAATPKLTGSRPVLVARNEVAAGKPLISIFPSSLHSVPGGGGLFLSVAAVHDGTLGQGREFSSRDAESWHEVSPDCAAEANCHRPAGGNASSFPLFQAAPCLPRASDASLLCWPKRFDLVGDPANATEGQVAAQVGAPTSSLLASQSVHVCCRHPDGGVTPRERSGGPARPWRLSAGRQ